MTRKHRRRTERVFQPGHPHGNVRHLAVSQISAVFQKKNHNIYLKQSFPDNNSDNFEISPRLKVS